MGLIELERQTKPRDAKKESLVRSESSVRRCRLVQAGLVRCNEGPGGMLDIMIETANSGTKNLFKVSHH